MTHDIFSILQPIKDYHNRATLRYKATWLLRIEPKGSVDYAIGEMLHRALEYLDAVEAAQAKEPTR